MLGPLVPNGRCDGPPPGVAGRRHNSGEEYRRRRRVVDVGQPAIARPVVRHFLLFHVRRRRTAVATVGPLLLLMLRLPLVVVVLLLLLRIVLLVPVPAVVFVRTEIVRPRLLQQEPLGGRRYRQLRRRRVRVGQVHDRLVRVHQYHMMMVMVDSLDPPRHVDNDPAGSNDGRVRRGVWLTSEGAPSVRVRCNANRVCYCFFF